jgi:hypothetical protein
MKTLSKVIAIIAVLLAILFAKGVGKMVGGYTVGQFDNGSAESEFKKTLTETAKQINSQLPMMVDSETRMDAVMCVGNQLHYKYTLINYLEKDIDKAALKNELSKKLIKDSCNNDNIIKTLKVGVEYYYNYFDKDGLSVMSLHLSKKECGL